MNKGFAIFWAFVVIFDMTFVGYDLAHDEPLFAVLMLGLASVAAVRLLRALVRAQRQ